LKFSETSAFKRLESLTVSLCSKEPDFSEEFFEILFLALSRAENLKQLTILNKLDIFFEDEEEEPAPFLSYLSENLPSNPHIISGILTS
jgi:putative ribosome biogenesis GTPase RsgA